MVGSSKFTPSREKGATACFWSFLVERKNEDSSMRRNCAEASRPAQFCMRIQHVLLVLPNSSAWIKKEPPFVSGLLLLKRRKNGDSSPSQNCVEASSLAQFCMRVQEMRSVLQSSSACVRRGATVRFRPFLVKGQNEDSPQSQNCTETSSLARFRVRIQHTPSVLQNSSTRVKEERRLCVSCLSRWKGRMKTLQCPRNASKLALSLSFA